MAYQRIVLMIIVIGLLVSAFQIIIWRVSKGNMFYKYIPTLVMLIITVACIVKAVWFSTGIEDLAYFILAIIASGVMLISLISGILIDVATRLSFNK